MYQAIVFLPLLGFLIAAAITMMGARARHPGADPSPDDDHGAHGHHADHAHNTHHAAGGRS